MDNFIGLVNMECSLSSDTGNNGFTDLCLVSLANASGRFEMVS
jgi:hypothetical protein